MTRLKLRGTFGKAPEADSDVLPFPTGGVWSLREPEWAAHGRRRDPEKHPAERALEFVQDRLDAVKREVDEAFHMPTDADPDRPTAA